MKSSTSPRPPLLIEDAFSPATCKEFIAFYKASDSRPRSYQGLVDHNVRQCKFVHLPTEYDPLFHEIALKKIQPYFQREIDPRLRTRPNVYGYPVGVGFVPHHDLVTEIEVARGRTNGQPVVGGDYTLVLFCNSPDEYGGGELYFPDHGWSYKPPAGTAVVYPSSEEYVHGVKPITSNIRYTTVSRFYAYPQRRPQLSEL